MKFEFLYLNLMFQLLCYCLSGTAEFLKMKKPYLPLHEINLGMLGNFSGSHDGRVGLNKEYIELLQKYFPNLKNRKSKNTTARFHEIDVPVNGQNQQLKSNSSSIKSNSSSTISKPLTTAPSLIHSGCSADQPNGTWSSWVISETCTSDCGSCGRQTRTRKCLSYDGKTGVGCPCLGEYKQLEPCNIGVCQFPRASCCPPYNLIFIEGFFACGPHNDTVIQAFLQRMASNG